jgi:ABC-type Zn uptake system ZnuABC Zn-binding protein ZnuA
MEIIKTYKNDKDGLESIIANGNDRHDYRVVMNDTDAGENLTVLFTNSLEQAHKAAKEFAFCIAIS